MNQAYTEEKTLYISGESFDHWDQDFNKKKSYAEILKICLTLKMITLKYNFKSIQKGLYEIVQNAIKMMSQFIWSSEPVYYKNWVTKPKTNQPNLKN